MTKVHIVKLHKGSWHQKNLDQLFVILPPAQPAGNRVSALVYIVMTGLSFIGIVFVVIKTIVLHFHPITFNLHGAKHFVARGYGNGIGRVAGFFSNQANGSFG